MYALYHHPYSQHARRVVALLEAAGIHYALQYVALEKREQLSPEYLAINPNHQVPVLIDGKLKLFESHAILRYLCAKHDLTDWYPNDLHTRARVDQWLDWNQCRLLPAVRDIVLNKVFLGDAGDQAAIARGEQNLPGLASILDTALAGRAFLIGDRPSIADLSIGSNLFQLGYANATPTLPNITKWYQRLGEIDGFKKSLTGASLS